MFQLTRLGLTLTAVSNCWLMIFLAVYVEPDSHCNPWLRSAAALPLWLALLLAAVVAAGLHAYGAALNDLLDVRRDRMFHPRRPLPSGRLSVQGAVIAAVIGLLGATIAALALGTGPVLVCLLVAAATLFYNATGKYLPATGIVTLGLIRMVGMFLPNPVLGFAWPIVLAMTHVIVCATVVYHIGGKRPRLQPPEQWGIAAGWAFWTLVLIGWMGWRDGLHLADHPRAWIGPAVAALLFALASLWLVRWAQRRGAGAAALRSFYGSVAGAWLIVYDLTWLLSAGLWWQGLVHAGLLVLACGAMGTLWLADLSPKHKATFGVSGEAREKALGT